MADCCSDPDPVPVLDKRIELGETKGGNKYRKRCINCGYWLPMTSAAFYDGHDRPHVLPLNGDPDDLDDTIPAEEYDHGPEREALLTDGDGDQDESESESDQDDGDGGEPESSTTTPTPTMDTEAEIRQREQQREHSDEPADLDGGGQEIGSGSSGSGGGVGLSAVVPSISRRQLLFLAAIALLAVTIYLKSTEDVAHIDEVNAEIAVDEDEDGADENEEPRIRLPTNPDNPLDMDAAIVADSGIFGRDG